MESNITEQQYLNGDLQLSEPHFDDEATVLGARPVVPLREIGETTTGAVSARQVVLGLAMVGSLIIGALGATLIYKQRGQERAGVIVNAAAPGSGAITTDSAATASATGDASGEVAKAAGLDASLTAEDKKPKPRLAPRVERPVTRRVASVEAAKRQEAPRYEIDESEMRRAERVDERRLRRAAEREAHRETRGRRNTSADDLLRIRDIFEGPRRP